MGLGAVNKMSPRRLDSSEFTAIGFRPGETRQLFFHHDQLQLGATRRFHADETGPVAVRLRPCGTITGRIVAPGGNPCPEMKFYVDFEPGQFDGVPRVAAGVLRGFTDKAGRFEMQGLLPEARYILVPEDRFGYVPRTDIRVSPGETRVLGDVMLMPL
jgi:hypothetical protein